MSNLLLSYELLCLMHWLLKNEKQLIQNLISKAIDNGLTLELAKINKNNTKQLDINLQNTFIDFITYLEEILQNSLIDKDLTSAFKKDSDINNFLTSLAEVKENPSRDILIQKIFKNWKPKNDEVH